MTSLSEQQKIELHGKTLHSIFNDVSVKSHAVLLHDIWKKFNTTCMPAIILDGGIPVPQMLLIKNSIIRNLDEYSF